MLSCCHQVLLVCLALPLLSSACWVTTSPPQYVTTYRRLAHKHIQQSQNNYLSSLSNMSQGSSSSSSNNNDDSGNGSSLTSTSSSSSVSGLPEIQGDFDWDAKFAGDSDWITESVPGKMVLNEIDLARQATALAALEEKWRKERLDQEYADGQNAGWVPKAELLNGRTAMFFLITGLLTEYWTGISLPGQVEEMLRIGGVIGFD